VRGGEHLWEEGLIAIGSMAAVREARIQRIAAPCTGVGGVSRSPCRGRLLIAAACILTMVGAILVLDVRTTAFLLLEGLILISTRLPIATDLYELFQT
jgi:hypothetical protein